MIYLAYLTIGGKDWRQQRSWRFETKQSRDEFIQEWRWGFDPMGLMPLLLQINFYIKFSICFPLFGLAFVLEKLGFWVRNFLEVLCQNEVIVTKCGEMTHLPRFARYKSNEPEDVEASKK